MGIISKVVQGSTDINDQAIFANSLVAAKGGAKAYLTATLVCTDPELRAFFSTQLDQCLMGHKALIELGLKKGWLDPNLTPKECLMKEMEKSNTLFNFDD